MFIQLWSNMFLVFSQNLTFRKPLEKIMTLVALRLRNAYPNAWELVVGQTEPHAFLPLWATYKKKRLHGWYIYNIIIYIPIYS